MFLIRLTFWLALAVLLLPADEHQQARLYSSAAAAVARVSSFCDRNPQVCAAGAELWAAFVKKAEFGARLALDLAMPQKRDADLGLEPVGVARSPSEGAEPRGTLRKSDLAPAWRGEVQASRS